MSKKPNKAGGGYARFTCTKCGCETTRRKSLAVMSARIAKGEAKPRVCRDENACRERMLSKKNENVLEKGGTD